MSTSLSTDVSTAAEGDQPNVLLASSSVVRLHMLQAAGLRVAAEPPRIDEETIRDSLLGESVSTRDIADALAEAKARKVAVRYPGRLVIGADQTLDCDGRHFSKAASVDEAREQLAALSGRTHRLFSAAVVARDGEILWRHVAEARLTMHRFGPEEIERYLAAEWDAVRESVGVYQIEGRGIRLMARVDGSHFAVLGLPLIELLTWLRVRGDITA
jgi:septum formation protein